MNVGIEENGDVVRCAVSCELDCIGMSAGQPAHRIDEVKLKRNVLRRQVDDIGPGIRGWILERDAGIDPVAIVDARDFPWRTNRISRDPVEAREIRGILGGAGRRLRTAIEIGPSPSASRNLRYRQAKTKHRS